MTSALDMPEIMSYIYSKSWKLQFSASSSIIIIEDYYLQTFIHSLRLDSFLYFFFYFKSSSLSINGKVAVFFFLNLICQVNTLIFTKKNRNIKTIPIAMHI